MTTAECRTILGGRGAMGAAQFSRVLASLVAALGVACLTGCTSESTRVALEAQRRADEVQQGIFDRQHDGLKVLLFRDTVRKMQDGEDVLSEAQQMALNDAWNERDLVEFWALQYERSKALRLAGVDAKLFSDQSVVDLLGRALDARWKRIDEAVNSAAAEGVAEKSVTPPVPPGEEAPASENADSPATQPAE